ncbi:MAG: hypothetical protein M3422_20000 [Actinomycetota bacterium]|nr:hypothetical protein [Actinomycetota bacterium]
MDDELSRGAEVRGPLLLEYGGQQPVERFETELGLPEGFFDRTGAVTPLFDRAIEWLTKDRPRRQNHWPALTLALVAQAEEGLLRLGTGALPDVFVKLEREDLDPNGQPVNTLNFVIPLADRSNELVRLRGKYNLALSLILTRMRRNGHPSNPGHATQSWPAYRPLIELIWAMAPVDRRALVAWTWEKGVLPLDETKIVAAVERPVRPFELVLAEMSTASSRPGSVWQGVCFGYLRADSPNLQLESSKAQTGSRRSALLGDVDGFVGDRVALAAECKDMTLGADWRDELTEFLAQVNKVPGTLALVMCADITEHAQDEITASGLIVLTREAMRKTAAVWDEPKQWTALQGLFYYLRRIQKSEQILAKVRQWCLERGIVEAGAGAIPQAEAAAIPEDEDSLEDDAEEQGIGAGA